MENYLNTIEENVDFVEAQTSFAHARVEEIKQEIELEEKKMERLEEESIRKINEKNEEHKLKAKLKAKSDANDAINYAQKLANSGEPIDFFKLLTMYEQYFNQVKVANDVIDRQSRLEIKKSIASLIKGWQIPTDEARFSKFVGKLIIQKEYIKEIENLYDGSDKFSIKNENDFSPRDIQGTRDEGLYANFIRNSNKLMHLYFPNQKSEIRKLLDNEESILYLNEIEAIKKRKKSKRIITIVIILVVLFIFFIISAIGFLALVETVEKHGGKIEFRQFDEMTY